MPIRREPKASSTTTVKSQPSTKQIEAFAAAADGGIPEPERNPLNPNAKRDFKAIRVPFNEYEFLKLEEAIQETGRTKLNFIRYAVLKLAKEVQKGD